MRELWRRIKEGLADMCYIWAKEMRTTFTDEGVLIFFILVPLLYPLLYSWVYNNQVVREVPVVAVDLSHSHMSRQFLSQFDASPDVRVAYYAGSLEEARDLMAKQIVNGVVLVPSDFDLRLNRMEQTSVSVYCDMALMLTYKAINQTAVAVATDFNRQIQVKLSGNMTDREDEVTIQPLDFDEVPIFSPTGGYGDFIIPGVLMLIIQQTLLLGIGLGAGTARETNRYRDLVPVSRHYNGIFRIVFGKSLCYLMIFAVMSAYLILAVPRIFGFIAIGDARALLGLMFPYLLACIFFGMMLSCLVRYRENVILLVVFTSVPFLFLSGISWPQSNIPGAWQGVSVLLPSTFGVRGFVRINSMGATLSDIQQEYQALWIQTTVYFFVTCLVYRFQINQAHQHAHERIQHLKDKATQARLFLMKKEKSDK